jgi:hypothetical protein
MRIRPDLGLREMGCALHDLNDAALWPCAVRRKELSLHYGRLMIGDQWCRTRHDANLCRLGRTRAAARVRAHADTFTGHVSLAQTVVEWR